MEPAENNHKGICRVVHVVIPCLHFTYTVRLLSFGTDCTERIQRKLSGSHP